MAVVKTEETLHHYLRRHFKKISESKARELAQESERPSENNSHAERRPSRLQKGLK